MSNVVRLPVRHRSIPGCSDCGRMLPSLSGTLIDLPEGFDERAFEPVSFTLSMRCLCGRVNHVRKALK